VLLTSGFLAHVKTETLGFFHFDVVDGHPVFEKLRSD
jgi:hypothetical protein